MATPVHAHAPAYNRLNTQSRFASNTTRIPFGPVSHGPAEYVLRLVRFIYSFTDDGASFFFFFFLFGFLQRGVCLFHVRMYPDCLLICRRLDRILGMAKAAGAWMHSDRAKSGNTLGIMEAVPERRDYSTSTCYIRTWEIHQCQRCHVHRHKRSLVVFRFNHPR